jgi:hypothetical protein
MNELIISFKGELSDAKERKFPLMEKLWEYVVLFWKDVEVVTKVFSEIEISLTRGGGSLQSKI